MENDEEDYPKWYKVQKYVTSKEVNSKPDKISKEKPVGEILPLMGGLTAHYFH